MRIMAKAGSRSHKGSSLPSMFDLSVIGMLGITFLPNMFLQGSYFVFYSIFIIVLAQLLKPQRDYTVIPLDLLVMWSLGMIFVHNSIRVVENSIVNSYFNISIMFEGFIYILVGVGLWRSIISYSRNPLWIFAFLPIALIPLVKQSVHFGSMTMLCAFIVSVVVYLLLKRQVFLGMLGIAVGGLVAVINWHWIQMKYLCRPGVWVELLKRIQDHPFIGKGFDHSLVPDNMVWISLKNYGYTYTHNDYLNIASCLGILALILVLCFVFRTTYRIGVSIYLIPFLTIVIASFFQITMFQPAKAALCIVIGAICVKETYKKEIA